jgi:hypothetical protein
VIDRKGKIVYSKDAGSEIKELETAIDKALKVAAAAPASKSKPKPKAPTKSKSKS